MNDLQISAKNMSFFESNYAKTKETVCTKAKTVILDIIKFIKTDRPGPVEVSHLAKTKLYVVR